MEQKFQNVVKEYRKVQGLSMDKFASQITAGMTNVKLSKMTISRWETQPNCAPDLYLFLNCVTVYTDWRRDFAVDALKAVLPHVFDSGMFVFHNASRR